MKYLLVATLILGLTVNSYADFKKSVIIDGKKIELDYRLGIIASGYLTFPSGDYSDNYDGNYGLEVGTGIVLTDKENPNLHIGTYYLKFSHHEVPLAKSLKNNLNISKDINAKISAFYFGEGTGIPVQITKHFVVTPFLGSAIGGAVFTLDKADLASLGGKTYTELQNENDRLQLAYYYQLGLLLTGVEHFSLQYSYDLVAIERSWYVWHSIISGLANSIFIKGIPKILGNAFPDEVSESLPYQITVLAYQFAASIFWYNFDYDNHNWPYDDAPPLEYQRQMLTFFYYF